MWPRAVGKSRTTGAWAVRQRPAGSAWPAFFHRLSQFALPDLDLDFSASHPSSHSLAALQTLTQLTALRVSGWNCLKSPANWQALASMAGMQRLCINHNKGRLHDGLDSLQALSALTSLTFRTSQADEQSGWLAPQ